MNSVVSTILCCTIDDFRRQLRAFKDFSKNDLQNIALQFTFDLRVNCVKEVGYRHLDLIAWAPRNYVGIFTKERWNVLSNDDLEDSEDGEIIIKKGKDYNIGSSDYEIHSYHDSCWREDGVRRVLYERESVIRGIDSLSTFYRTINVDDELQNKFRQLIDNRRNH